MQRLAKETGGASFEVSKDQTIEKIYAQIEDSLRNQYSLGYTPERTDASKKYRKIKLTTKRADLSVQTRDGYYPKVKTPKNWRNVLTLPLPEALEQERA